MPETFSEFLRSRREALGITIARFAELVGRSPSTVRGWERGRSRPGDPATVAAISAVLDLDEDTLMALIAGEDIEVPAQPVAVIAPSFELPVMAPPMPPVAEATSGFFVPMAVSPLEEERVRRIPFLPSPPRKVVVERADRGLRYQARTAATIVGVILLALVLRWALGEFGGAFGDLKTSVFGP